MVAYRWCEAAETGMELERSEIYFSGRVQGVGFRYTTLRMASNYDVTGFVKNLPDGRVLLVAEGRRDEVDSFVSSVQREMAENIVSCDSSHSDYLGEFDGFQIVH